MDNSKQIKRQNEFIAEKYDRFTMTFPKGKKDIYRAYAESHGMSLNGYINKLIAADMEQEQTGIQSEHQTEHQTEHQSESTAKPHNSGDYIIVIPKEKVENYRKWAIENHFETIEEAIFFEIDDTVQWEIDNGYIK